MRSNGPVTLSLPPFRGTTRRIILTAIFVFLAGWVLSWFSRDISDIFMGLLVLEPTLALHRLIWQFVTYPFYSLSLLSLLFSLLQVWFFGAALEEERGTPWFAEFFFVTSIAGGFAAALLSLAAMGHLDRMPTNVSTWGLWPATLALLIAFAYLHPNEPLKVYFVLPIKAKYLAWAYLLVYVLATFFGGDQFGALTAVCVALASYLYLRFAPRKGLRYAMSERWYGWRNDYYRGKRRRAAKKFAVYMKEQGKEASFDEDGRYVDPSGTPRDPNDRRWMN